MGLFQWLTSSTAVDADDIPVKTQCYHVEGFLSCAYFQNAIRVADRLTAKHPDVKVDVSAYIKAQWKERSEELREEFQSNHTTSPFIYEGCTQGQQNVVGGYSDFARHVRETFKMNVPLD